MRMQIRRLPVCLVSLGGNLSPFFAVDELSVRGLESLSAFPANPGVICPRVNLPRGPIDRRTRYLLHLVLQLVQVMGNMVQHQRSPSS